MQVSDAILGTAGHGGFKDGSTTSIDYTYDANKGITGIVYSHLNLPIQVTLAGGNICILCGGALRKGTVYLFSERASRREGRKLKKIVTDQTAITETSYAGNYIYEEAAGVEELKFFNQPEGYVEPEDAADYTQGFSYIYQYKDHLGNIRLSYTDVSLTSTPSLEIVEENNYYPFGLKHKGYNSNVNGVDHKYGFGGKEEQDDNLGGNQLNWYDFGARNYDAALGRWFVLDAFAEKAPSLTPYRYAFNNPINIIDPDGNYEQDDFRGQDDYYSSVTIYGGKGGPISIGSSGSSKEKEKEECPDCDNIKILLDFINSAAKKDGEELANEDIKNAERWTSEDVGHYSDDISYGKKVNITGNENLDYKENFIKWFTAGTVDDNDYRFNQDFTVFAKGKTHNLTAMGLIVKQKDKKDMNISSMDRNVLTFGGFSVVTALNFYNDKGKMTAKLTFKNSNQFEHFWNKYYLKPRNISRNKVLKAYKINKNK